MKTLQKPIEQLAGNLELFVLPCVNIKTLNGTALTIVNEDLLLKMICMRESISHLATSGKSKQGLKFTHRITATTYGRSAENDLLLNEFERYKLYAIVRDQSGNYYGVGQLFAGLEMTWEYDSGSDPSAPKGYTITLSGKLLSYTQPITVVNDYAGNPISEVIAPAPEGD